MTAAWPNTQSSPPLPPCCCCCARCRCCCRAWLGLFWSLREDSSDSTELPAATPYTTCGGVVARACVRDGDTDCDDEGEGDGGGSKSKSKLGGRMKNPSDPSALCSLPELEAAEEEEGEEEKADQGDEEGGSFIAGFFFFAGKAADPVGVAVAVAVVNTMDVPSSASENEPGCPESTPARFAPMAYPDRSR